MKKFKVSFNVISDKDVDPDEWAADLLELMQADNEIIRNIKWKRLK